MKKKGPLVAAVVGAREGGGMLFAPTLASTELNRTTFDIHVCVKWWSYSTAFIG